MKHILMIFIGLTLCTVSSAQILNPVSWSYAAKKNSATVATVYLKAQVAHGWHIYAQNIPKEKNMSTSFNFYPSKEYRVMGITTQPKPITKYEESIGLTVGYFKNYAIFMQKVKLNKVVSTTVKGEVTYMACDASRCLSPETLTFNIPVK